MKNKKMIMAMAAVAVVAIIGIFTVGTIRERTNNGIAVELSYGVSEVSALDISATNHQVEFHLTDGDKVEIVASKGSLTGNISNGTLSAQAKNRYNPIFNRKVPQLDIYLPRNSHLEIHAQTKSGDISAYGIGDSAMELTTSKGKIQVSGT